MDDELLAGIDRWLAQAAADEQAAGAAREAEHVRRLVEAMADDDDLRSVLVALGDRSELVALTLSGVEREVRGRLQAAGDDFVVVRDGADGPPVFVALGGIAGVRLPPGSAWAGGVVEAETEVGGRRRRRGSLRAVLAGLAAEGPRVQVLGPGGPRTASLRAVGVDVVVLDAGSTEAVVTFVPLSAVRAVVLLDWS